MMQRRMSEVFRMMRNASSGDADMPMMPSG